MENRRYSLREEIYQSQPPSACGRRQIPVAHHPFHPVAGLFVGADTNSRASIFGTERYGHANPPAGIQVSTFSAEALPLASVPNSDGKLYTGTVVLGTLTISRYLTQNPAPRFRS